MATIRVPIQLGPLSANVLQRINESKELSSIWKVTNVTAKTRLHMTDHGVSHFQRVVDTSLTILDILHNQKIKLSLTTDYDLDYDHSQLVVMLASLLHDVGMSIHRQGHEEFSLFISYDYLNRLLEFLPLEERIILRSEVLHAIISHRSDGRPLSVEAGIVRVADALDLTRTRVEPDEDTKYIDIHTVSANSIDEVEVVPGDSAPVAVNISMNHTAGLFQVDELLKHKINNSGIEQYLDVKVYITKDNDRVLLKQYLGNHH
jgi:metal-dependent HD superfamily phosphatase/phosphodiesterase